MDRTALAALIERHEGRRHTAYYDTVGKLTIGVGQNLDDPLARQTIESFGWNYDDLRNGGYLDDAQIDQLLDNSISIAIFTAKGLFPNLDLLPDNVQMALIDISFSLGSVKLSKFIKLRAAIASKDFSQAAAEMVDSAWYHQVGNRGIEDVALMKGAVNVTEN